MIEAVLLTGGRSSRMGRDKAAIPIDGVPMGERIARELARVCEPVTVVGRSAIEGFAFLEDEEEFAGPLVALSRVRPVAEFVFVASCDLPLFDASVVEELAVRIGDADAAIPVVDGRLQPLCALYRASAFGRISPGQRRVMAWLGSLQAVGVTDLPRPEAVRNANLPEELDALRN